jgi:hypothetical protein
VTPDEMALMMMMEVVSSWERLGTTKKLFPSLSSSVSVALQF